MLHIPHQWYPPLRMDTLMESDTTNGGTGSVQCNAAGDSPEVNSKDHQNQGPDHPTHPCDRPGQTAAKRGERY